MDISTKQKNTVINTINLPPPLTHWHNWRAKKYWDNLNLFFRECINWNDILRRWYKNNKLISQRIIIIFILYYNEYLSQATRLILFQSIKIKYKLSKCCNWKKYTKILNLNPKQDESFLSSGFQTKFWNSNGNEWTTR